MHFDGLADDPVKIWEKLETVHLRGCPGMRFSTWEEFGGERVPVIPDDQDRRRHAERSESAP